MALHRPMSRSVQSLLDEPDDKKLCRQAYALLADHFGDGADCRSMPSVARNVLFVRQTSGIVGNGGFRYLFSSHFPGDPSFEFLAPAFGAVGCAQATEAVEKSLAVFPKSRPPSSDEKRLRIYLKRIKDFPTREDEQLWRADCELTRCLATYIRANRQAMIAIVSAPIERTNRENPAAMQEVRDQPWLATLLARIKSGVANLLRDRDEDAEIKRSIGNLPHWSRVAFAARCARRVYPLYAKYWPTAPIEPQRALATAIQLAERSVAEKMAVEGLDQAEANALGAAGRAYAPDPGFQGRPKPLNAFDGTLAAYAAQVAVRAAACAQANPSESARPAREAWYYACEAAKESDPAIIDALREDLLLLIVAANRR